MIASMHGFLVLAAWSGIAWAMAIAGCAELDRTEDPVTDLGEEPINAEGWIWQ